MAKYNVEIDPETKSFRFTRDGLEVSYNSLSIGCYTYIDGSKDYYLSYSYKESGEEVSRHVWFSTEEVYANESLDQHKISEKVGNIHRNIKASKSVADILSKKYKDKKNAKGKKHDKKEKDMDKE